MPNLDGGDHPSGHPFLESGAHRLDLGQFGQRSGLGWVDRRGTGPGRGVGARAQDAVRGLGRRLLGLLLVPAGAGLEQLTATEACAVNVFAWSGP